jgi:AAHS family 4-hydroxybenzoate transporter-like MFS transporter
MSSAQRIDVSTILDGIPISARQWLILFLGFITLSVDGFDVTSMGFIAPALIDDWHIARQALGPIMVSSLFGLACGSIISGPLADRYGRKTVIICSVGFFGLSSFVSAYAWNIASLTVLRFITGLGLGAAMPNITTLVAEFAPKRRRSQMSTVIHCGFNIGAAIGGLASDRLIHWFGWRSVLVAGGVLPVCLAIVLIYMLPESIRFLAQDKGNHPRLVSIINRFSPGMVSPSTQFYNSEDSNIGKSTIHALFMPGYRMGTWMIWLILCVGLFSVYLLSSWLPLLVRDSGLSLTQAVVIGSVFQIGGMVGNFSIGYIMDRWGAHKTIGCTLFIGACSALALAILHPSMSTLCLFVGLLGMSVNSVNPGCYALSAQFYPTFMRATGVSWATGIGRLGAIVGAGAGSLMLAANWSFNQVFLFLPLLLVIGVLATYGKAHSTGSKK